MRRETTGIAFVRSPSPEIHMCGLAFLSPSEPSSPRSARGADHVRSSSPEIHTTGLAIAEPSEPPSPRVPSGSAKIGPKPPAEKDDKTKASSATRDDPPAKQPKATQVPSLRDLFHLSETINRIRVKKKLLPSNLEHTKKIKRLYPLIEVLFEELENEIDALGTLAEKGDVAYEWDDEEDEEEYYSDDVDFDYSNFYIKHRFYNDASDEFYGILYDDGF